LKRSGTLVQCSDLSTAAGKKQASFSAEKSSRASNDNSLVLKSIILNGRHGGAACNKKDGEGATDKTQKVRLTQQIKGCWLLLEKLLELPMDLWHRS
jgi:hypothetical protein